jgi:hypothetical protein
MESVIEARRAKFEAWQVGVLIQEGYDSDSVHCVMERGSTGGYSSIRVEGAWRGFNAALDSLVIELPKKVDHFADDDPGRRAFSFHTNHAIDQCRQAIEKAGVRVNG